uniref:C-type lectin domain-containing protein n=1 Tax=Oryzias latipes TaxID=8090 RepID=A0A3P9KLW3_ORYLA
MYNYYSIYTHRHINEKFSASNFHLLSTERRFCAGVAPDSKCYQFFKGPKTFKDAEYFCRQHFSEGHLASITSQFINQEVSKLILEQNGSYARVWVGGYRLDVSGLNPEGFSFLNDFTCWTPQAFVCSYPHH